MKKLLALFLAVLMLLSLVSCNISSRLDDEDDTYEDQDNGDNENDTDDEQSNPSDDLKNKIDISKIKSGLQFSEGKAWVRCAIYPSEEAYTLYCINKNGEILFTLNNASLNDPSPFHNGLSVVIMRIDDSDDSYDECLCDEKGNIIKPSDVGATEFLIDSSDFRDSYYTGPKLFKDGYIFAKKTEATYSGSSVTAAILNSSLEVVAGYSEEILTLYEEYKNSTCYDGCLYRQVDYTTKYKMFDVKEGKEKEFDDAATLMSYFEPEYESDMWGYDRQSCVYYDSSASDFTVTLDLSEYSETISQMYPFENGKAPLLFKSADKAFFTVIKEDGSFCFEPVELHTTMEPMLKRYKDKYLLCWGISVMTLETFDTNGKIAETELTFTTNLVSYPDFCDDVIDITDYGERVQYYYSLEFEPLF